MSDTSNQSVNQQPDDQPVATASDTPATDAISPSPPLAMSLVMQTVKFLQALFHPCDWILFRFLFGPGDPRTPQTRYFRLGGKDATNVWAHSDAIASKVVKEVFALGESLSANVFFGVCPRFDNGGKYDRAWQIRTVRALWADLDDCDPAMALKRCAESVPLIPEPSIVVKSGNGVHLYWLLDSEYVIDDGDQRPILKEKVSQKEPVSQGPAKGKKSRKYLMDGTEKVYLSRATEPRISPKAERIQDAMSGLAAAIKGDSTHDVSRILRLPGTLNRKQPVPRPCIIERFDWGGGS